MEEGINQDFIKTPGFKAGHAFHIENKKNRRLFRLLEIFPGVFSWGTLILVVVFSYFKPALAAYFIIAFDLYWLLKTIYLSLHHMHNWRRMKYNIEVDWGEMLKDLKYEHIYHMIMLPFSTEGEEILESTLRRLSETKYDKDKLLIVLASEKGVEGGYQVGLNVKEKYKNIFKYILVTSHPANLPGEIRGKGSNASWGAEKARVEILDKNNIPYDDVIVSNFDSDTLVWPQYFSCLTWNFLTTKDRYNASFQPVPLYNNNLWDAPPFSRVAAMSSTFWQMIQQERPESLETFSSHAVSFTALYRIGYWQKNMVSEDSRIFWNMFLAHNGNYRVVPIAYPVSMDANLDKSFWKTAKNVYKQHRRWMWGVENIPYVLFNFIKHKQIPLKKKIKRSLVLIEGFWSLATNPILILLLGWLPLVLGGSEFKDTILSYNLPIFTRNLMTIAMSGLILSAIISASLAPPLPSQMKQVKRRWMVMIFQWILIPITIVVFGAIPGLDAQTRLMFGKYMGFWVTPKHRKNKI
jgi:hypothetical protein